MLESHCQVEEFSKERSIKMENVLEKRKKKIEKFKDWSWKLFNFLFKMTSACKIYSRKFQLFFDYEDIDSLEFLFEKLNIKTFS